MAKTSIQDIIEPLLFEKYVIERTAQKTAIVESGIVAPDAQFDQLVQEGIGGTGVTLPYWVDLSGTRQVLSDTQALTAQKIVANKDYARIQRDSQVWSANDLAKWIAGDDPMAAVADRVASYWQRQDQGILVASLKGVFASASMATNILNIAQTDPARVDATTKLNGATFVDALAKLGDRADRLTAVAMHSATEAALKKNNLIEYAPDSEGLPTIANFQGRRVIVDDGCPVSTAPGQAAVYTTFLFGEGAFAKGSATLDTPVEGGFGTEGVEFARVALGSDTLLINRRCFILHPRGVKWNNAAVVGTSPTDEELANGANWTRVYESKNVRLVAVMHNN